jgi:hypothetical protein
MEFTAQRAYASLVAAVEEMRRRLGLERDTTAIVNDIKKTMHLKVPPHGLTVLQVLYERENENAFNQTAVQEFPTIRQEFDHAIQDFMVVRDGRVSARKVRKIGRNTWKEDAGANRRIREMEDQSPAWRSPYRGQPERYDPRVVLAFATAIARAIDRPRITWTRGTEDHKSSGPTLDVLVAAVRWAMCVAWVSAAGGEPPKVKAGGLLEILKANRR